MSRVSCVLTLSATEVAGIHASTMILSRVGIPLLRFHPHPSQCRSIGQTIGLTAYSPQRAAIFTMPLLTRTCPAYFRLGALFEASDISTPSEPTVPSGIVSFGPADPVCARHLSCKGSLTPRLKSGACARPVMVSHHLVATIGAKFLGVISHYYFTRGSVVSVFSCLGGCFLWKAWIGVSSVSMFRLRCGLISLCQCTYSSTDLNWCCFCS